MLCIVLLVPGWVCIGFNCCSCDCGCVGFACWFVSSACFCLGLFGFLLVLCVGGCGLNCVVYAIFAVLVGFLWVWFEWWLVVYLVCC